MMLSGIAVAIVALLAWIWLSRGFFSAFLNMICCIAAGAIAFGVWEPLAYMLLDKFNGNDALGSSVWAISLALPFAVSMALLRVAVDKCCPANMKFDGAVNAIGGGACGAVSGVITAGILIISMGFLRVEREFLSYTPVAQQANGGLQTESSLMFPVDKITAGFYKLVSNGSLATTDPLSRWYPDLVNVPATMRISYGDGKARNTINTKDFEVWRRFTVGGKDTKLNDLLVDDWDTTGQSIADTEGNPFPSGTTLEGYVLNFMPSARERSGSVVIGNAQIRLLLEKGGENPDYMTVHPITAICQAAAEKVMFARFRFNAPDIFISSVGGASESRMGFEFPIPPGYTPLALYVKNARVPIPANIKPIVYGSAADRDSAIRKGTMFDQPSEVDSVIWQKTPPAGEVRSASTASDDLGVVISPSMLNVTLQQGTERSMKYSGHSIVEGHEIYDQKTLDVGRVTDPALRINEFQTKPDTVIVHVNVSVGRPLTWSGKYSVGPNAPFTPQIVDAEGTIYEPVGYIYKDDKFTTIHFNRSQPIRSASDLPPLSTTKLNQNLDLIFDVSKGVKMVRFQLGPNQVIHEFKPPMDAAR